MDRLSRQLGPGAGQNANRGAASADGAGRERIEPCLLVLSWSKRPLGPGAGSDLSAFGVLFFGVFRGARRIEPRLLVLPGQKTIKSDGNLQRW